MFGTPFFYHQFISFETTCFGFIKLLNIGLHVVATPHVFRLIEHYASVIYPIIAAGDVSGAVVMLTGEQTKIPTNAEIKLAQTAAAFLGKQMEE